jgi:adenylate kinase family enzyme
MIIFEFYIFIETFLNHHVLLLIMVKIIFIRGAPAVGKTTIVLKLLKLLKDEHKLDCAYICEDDFRKQMQFKYKAKDTAAHMNSAELIKSVIKKLLELDKYDLIFIEGQFRYKEVLDKYTDFIKEQKFKSILLQFTLDFDEMKKRDVELRNTKSKDIEEVKKDIDFYIPPNAIIIQTKKPINETIQEVLLKIVE